MTDSMYTSALADTICERLSEGESLRSICRDPGMPTEGAVRAWARENRDGFASRYRLARELQLEFWADQIVEIADASASDPRDRQVRIDTRKWLMSKLGPRDMAIGFLSLARLRETLKKAHNAPVGRFKPLIFHGSESAASNFSVFPESP